MRYLGILLGLFLIVSCARQGTPTGGPKDETPPKFLNSNPDTLSLNVPTDLNEIRINFDEYILLKDHTQNIIVSPPFGKNPTYMPVGTPNKYVRIKLNEPLKENTTYNINFGNSIQDHNEGNKLPYFQYVFSTGAYIDSLEISGKAKIPSMRKQPKNLMVGLYKVDSAYTDSLILTEKPFYIAKAGEDGSFKLNYLHSGKYQLIAFDDEVQNMQFDLGKEMFGFVEEPIELGENQTFSLELSNQSTAYRVGKAEQKGYGHLVFRFSGNAEKVEVKSLDYDFTTSKISYIPKSDSLNFWFNPSLDSIAEKSKRLRFTTQYKGQVDTISLVYNTTQKHNLKVEKIGKLTESPTRKPTFRTNYPLTHVDSAYVRVMKDTIQLTHRLIQNPKKENEFSLDFPIELSSQYKIEFLPNALRDFFGETNDSLVFEVRTQAKNDLGNLHLKLEGKPNHPFWLQLLDEKDEVLEEIYTTASEFEFNFLKTGNYYFKILVDENENEFWDAGDFFTKKQAEKSFLYPEMISVRALWDMNETWILTAPETPKPQESEIEKSPSETEEDSL